MKYLVQDKYYKSIKCERNGCEQNPTVCWQVQHGGGCAGERVDAGYWDGAR